MKKSVIILIFLCMLQVSLITADLFNIGYTGGGEELSIGGTPPTGDPEVTPPPTPPSGGGTTPTILAYSFQLSPSFFPIEIRRGGSLEQQITILNDGTQSISINISITSVEQFVFPEIESFTLASGATKTIKFNVYVSETENTEIYTGKINFNSPTFSKYASIVLDVTDKAPLFDIKTTVLQKTILPGRQIFADINILNLGDLKNIDVELLYYLIDFQNNTYIQKKESFAINESYSGEFFLDIPKDMELGEYLFYSRVSYGSIMASSYDSFSIINRFIGLLSLISGKSVLYLISLIILCFIALLSVILIRKILENKNQSNTTVQTHNI